MLKKALLLTLIPGVIFADIYGKLIGKVTDESGKPLPGANVFVVGTKLGTATDSDGNYFILNIPPGTYTIKVTYLGYESKEIEGIVIEADRSTFLNVILKESPIKVKPIVVHPREGVVRRDITWRAEIVKNTTITSMPLENAQQVLKVQGGVTEGPGGELHVRGGRSDETAYYIDGLPIVNPVTGKTISLLDRSFIQEMSLIAGTFQAEYGNALAGVVNVVTREGTEQWQGVAEIWSTPLYVSKTYDGKWFIDNLSLYQRKDWFGENTDSHRDTTTGISLYKPPHPKLPGSGRVWLSGSIPHSGLKVFVSSKFEDVPSHLPFGYRSEKGLLGKVTYEGHSLKFILTGEVAKERSQQYSHAWKYHPSGYPVTRSSFARLQVSMRHMLTQSLFYRFIIGYQRDDDTTQVDEKAPEEYSPPVRDDFLEFYVDGDYPLYRAINWASRVAKFDMVYQHGRSEFKIGGMYRAHALKRREYEQLYVLGFIGEPQRENFERNPIEANAYIQNKLELDNLVLNMGLRFDYFDPRAKMWENIKDPYSPLRRVKPKYQVSPRIGISLPVSERLVFFFSYGHFFQIPSFEALYRHPSYLNPDSLPVQLGIVGNPGLSPKRTVGYEAGLSMALNPKVSILMSIYGRDIRGLLTTREVHKFPFVYYVYDNQDFGMVRGIEFGIKFRPSSSTTARLTYTFQVARGNRSSPIQGFYNAYTGQVEVMKEFYLDFDRRHMINFSMLHSWKGFSVGMILSAASGLPYTPFIAPGIVAEENSARMPWTSTIDLNVSRKYTVGKTSIEFLLDIRNLLDTKNVRYVYPETGDPFNPGRIAVGMRTEDYGHDPSNLGPPRTIRVGIRTRWLP